MTPKQKVKLFERFKEVSKKDGTSSSFEDVVERLKKHVPSMLPFMFRITEILEGRRDIHIGYVFFRLKASIERILNSPARRTKPEVFEIQNCLKAVKALQALMKIQDVPEQINDKKTKLRNSK